MHVCVCVRTAWTPFKPREMIITVPAVVGRGVMGLLVGIRVTDRKQCCSFMYMLMIYTGWGAGRHFLCIFYHILKKAQLLDMLNYSQDMKECSQI